MVANQTVSLQSAGGNLDLLDAMRGQGRRKTQAEMLRDQSLAPVDVGSYNGIQSAFPVTQGFNKIAQGLLADYMDKQDKAKAQGESDRQTAEAQGLADALNGTPEIKAQPAIDAQPGTAPMPGDTATESPQDAQKRIAMARAMMVVPPDQAQPVDPSQPTTPQGQAQGPLPAPMPGQRMEALPGMGAPDDPGTVGQAAIAGQAATTTTPEERQRLLLAAQLSNNPGMARVADFATRQDEMARLQKERLDAQAFQAEQGRLQREALAREGAANRNAAAAPAAAEMQRQIEMDKQYHADAKDFADTFFQAPTDQQPDLLKRAMLSGNPIINKFAQHMADTDAKVAGSRDAAAAKSMIVPPAVLSQFTTQLDAYKTTARTVDQIDKSIARLDSGELKFDPFNNISDKTRNFVGMNSEQSRAKAEYQNDVQRLANDTLMMAKGMQTEGDAKRAYDLIVGNLNDPQIVRTQLEKLRRIAADGQDTAALSLNIASRAHPGLGQDPVGMSKPMPEPKGAARPTQAVAPSGPGTQNSPIHVNNVQDALRLPVGTWIMRPNGQIGQVPAR